MSDIKQQLVFSSWKHLIDGDNYLPAVRQLLVDQPKIEALDLTHLYGILQHQKLNPWDRRSSKYGCCLYDSQVCERRQEEAFSLLGELNQAEWFRPIRNVGNRPPKHRSV
jgi:hypothetical protein